MYQLFNGSQAGRTESASQRPRGAARYPHKLRSSGNTTNHYLLVFSPPGFEEFVMTTAVLAPDNAVAPTEPPAVAVRNGHELAADYGIVFG